MSTASEQVFPFDTNDSAYPRRPFSSPHFGRVDQLLSQQAAMQIHVCGTGNHHGTCHSCDKRVDVNRGTLIEIEAQNIIEINWNSCFSDTVDLTCLPQTMRGLSLEYPSASSIIL
ncbi:hypothetical protein XU18_3870 [Perkinsela sp. CCAP 1560/4]|nr:hypothetical protein XU18_3870 [Perkinsela sp. CCAP 1560/4]|eukprot:KNH04996.1 hypothetical protein XU18_3870 [Perkinsela sp. CCAP 1560/4]